MSKGKKQPSSRRGERVLARALAIMAPLVTWLLRSGIGYTEFAAALKPVFLKAAREELARAGDSASASALSMLAGLHRKDVRVLQESADAPLQAPANKISPASQVATRWLTSKLPQTLPLAGKAPSFEALARTVSTDIHPRSVLRELLRLGIVREQDQRVTLQRQAFVPDSKHEETHQLMSESVADHLAAGVHNLTSGEARQFLEQSVFADGLSAESARRLEKLASELWHKVLQEMVAAAVPLCEKDEPAGGDQRIRLGMFCYSASMHAGASAAAQDGRGSGDTTQ